MATATARDVLTRALRRMGVLSEYESMSADQGATGLAALNDMLAAFPAEGIDYAHADLSSLDSVVNVPDELVRSVTYMAVRDLADGYGYMPSAMMADSIVNAKLALQAHYHVTPPAAVDPALTRRRGGSYDIDTDE